MDILDLESTEVKIENKIPKVFTANETKKRILIVEDEAAIRDLVLSRARNHLDYECQWDDTGCKALSISEEFEPDLILLDMSLPCVSGLQIIRQIRSHPDLKEVPIIVFSAFGEPKLVEEAMSEGASLYFTKGGSVTDLFVIIQRFLN